MAYIGKVSIRDTSHMERAIDYIAREDKALSLKTFKQELSERLLHLQNVQTASGERMTCLNCSSQNTFKEFENLRRTWKQDKGVISHHYFQSFQKDDNITPELAHKIGVMLAKKMFPDYQVVISTHIDREHVHNHLIVNSCNMITGRKWYSNKRSLFEIRKESDKLCLQHGLGVIQKNSKYKGIDRTTYQLGLKGKSWKVNLTFDLEKAIACCKSKEDFIAFLEKKDYTVRYTDKHITITKNGEKKGIRVDTLAKQFGDKFRKENLEKEMGYYSPLISTIAEDNLILTENSKKYTSVSKSNWEYFEQDILAKQVNQNTERTKQTEHLSQLTECVHSLTSDMINNMYKFLIFVSSQAKKKIKKRSITKKSQYKEQIQNALKDTNTIKLKETRSFGNVNYYKLTESAGNNFTVKVRIDKLLKLVNQPILFSSLLNLNNGTATITIKEKDKNRLADMLGMVMYKDKLFEQNEKLSNQMMYKKIKDAAEYNGSDIKYMIVTKEQYQKIKDNFIECAAFDKDEKYNIAFIPENYELIRKIIYPKENVETPKQKNIRIYNELKKKAAQSGEKLRYQTKLNDEQLKALIKSGIELAYFVNSDDATKFNVAFEKKNEELVKSILNSKSKENVL